MEWQPAGWSVCLPLLISACTIKSRSSLLAPAHPGGPGKRAVKRLKCMETNLVNNIANGNKSKFLNCEIWWNLGEILRTIEKKLQFQDKWEACRYMVPQNLFPQSSGKEIIHCVRWYNTKITWCGVNWWNSNNRSSCTHGNESQVQMFTAAWICATWNEVLFYIRHNWT